MNKENQPGKMEPRTETGEEKAKVSGESANSFKKIANEKHVVMSQDEFERAKLSQSLPKGVLTGIVAGMICAALWAVITVITKQQVGYMAIGVGAAVGLALRYFGKGVTPVFGIIGAVIALLSCALGNLLSMIGLVSVEFGTPFFQTLSNIDFESVRFIMTESFDVMDILFYILAIAAGYSFSFRKVVIS